MDTLPLAAWMSQDSQSRLLLPLFLDHVSVELLFLKKLPPAANVGDANKLGEFLSADT